jgi:hypothetical protein
MACEGQWRSNLSWQKFLKGKKMGFLNSGGPEEKYGAELQEEGGQAARPQRSKAFGERPE